MWRLFHLDKVHPLATYAMSGWDIQSIREVDILNGACLLAKKKILEEIGYFDERYFMYSEEVDLCYQIHKAGFKIVWVPEAEVIHFGGQSTRQNQTQMFMQLYQSKIQYFRKNHGLLQSGIYKIILIVASLARLVVSPISVFYGDAVRQKYFLLANNYLKLLSAIPHM
jgi:GT2 family glycosyltransferase